MRYFIPHIMRASFNTPRASATIARSVILRDGSTTNNIGAHKTKYMPSMILKTIVLNIFLPFYLYDDSGPSLIPIIVTKNFTYSTIQRSNRRAGRISCSATGHDTICVSGNSDFIRNVAR